jgi:glycosyltransferase involved in cell wall biosynthesis
MDSIPVITIVTPVLNDISGLKKTLKSIELVDALELVIVDGGSSDGSWEYAEKFSKHDNVSLIRQRSLGLYGAFNDGISSARGQRVLFLYCGDITDITSVLAVVKENADNDIIACSCTQRGNEGDTSVYLRSKRPEITSRSVSILHPSLIIKRDKYTQEGGFDESFKVSGDVDCILRMLSNGASVVYLDKVIVDMAPWGVSNRLYLRKLYEHSIIRSRRVGFFSALSYMPKRLVKDFLLLPLWIRIRPFLREENY